MGSLENKKSIPNWVYVITAFIIIVVVPGAMAMLMLHPRFSGAPGGIDGWLSYWGGYLGGVIGMIAVVATTFHLINKQNLNHQEQIKEQNRQHMQLLENQNKQHQEQIVEQRIAIERAAELNDQTERDRIHFSVISRKNEGILELLPKLFNLNLKRLNSIRGIAEYKSQMESQIQSFEFHDNHRRREKDEELISELNSEIKMSLKKINNLKDDNTEIREEILLNLVNLKVKSEYFPLHAKMISVFANSLQDSLHELYLLMDDDGSSREKLLEKVEEHQTNFDSEASRILIIFNDELLESLKKFKDRVI